SPGLQVPGDAVPPGLQAPGAPATVLDVMSQDIGDAWCSGTSEQLDVPGHWGRSVVALCNLQRTWKISEPTRVGPLSCDMTPGSADVRGVGSERRDTVPTGRHRQASGIATDRHPASPRQASDITTDRHPASPSAGPFRT